MSQLETLRSMASLLAGSGRIWLSVPNADCIDSRRLKDRWHSAELPIHLMHFTPQSLRQAGRKAVLEVRSLVTLSLPRGVASSIRTRMRHRFLIPHRLSSRIGIIDTYFGPKLAREMDNSGRGEAILAEFVAA